MQGSKQAVLKQQRGISLVGLIVVLAILGFLFIIAAKVVPTYTEYMAIKNAIQTAKHTDGSLVEMQKSFAKAAEVNDITAIKPADLVVTKEDGQTEISFDYEKRVPLFGNVSLLIEYSGTTAASGKVAAKEETPQ